MSSPPLQTTGVPSAEPRPFEGTVVFIDMAGFTALTDTHGDAEALDVVEQFEAAVRANLRDPAALIKFIGDEAMLVFDRWDDAIAVIVGVVDDCASDGFPELRVGLHRGPLTWRAGDPYGSTVNLASRIAGHAAGGQVLASASTVPPEGAAITTPAGQFRARGISHPVELVEVRTNATPTSIDPVCQMRLARGQGVAIVHHDGEQWELCSLTCARRFTTNPNLYLAQLRQPSRLPGAGVPGKLIG